MSRSAFDLLPGAVTIFRNKESPKGTWKPRTPDDYRAMVDGEEKHADRDSLPLLSFTRFAGNHRSTDTVREIHALALDHDSGTITVAEVARRLTREGIAAVVVTTRKNSLEKPRLRIFVPLAKPVNVSEHRRYVRIMNAILRGVLAPESEYAQQPWFYGRVEGVPHECVDVAGEPLDTLVAEDPGFYPEQPCGNARASSPPALIEAAENCPLAEIDPTIQDTPAERERLHAALMCIDPCGDRQTYLKVLMALASTGWADWRDLARQWASGDLQNSFVHKFNERHFLRDTKKLDLDGGVTIATLYHLAKENGFDAARKKAASSSADGIQLTSAVDMIPVPTKWVWEGWLAQGKLAINAGAPGTGKTTIAMACAAIVSTGGTWPDGARSPAGNVLIWSGEDDPRDTLVPRLIAADGDRRRIYFVGDASDGLERRPFDPAKDMAALQARAESIGNIRLMVIDPIVSVVAGDSHNNGDVRKGLAPLVEFAEKSGAALLGISHFTKGTGGRDPLERVTGSVAFGAVARIVWVTACTENEAGETVRILARAKSNIGPDDGGFAYSFDQVELPEHPGVTASKIEWRQALTGRARDLLAERDEPKAAPQREDAAAWLEKLLQAGPVLVKDVRIKANEDGHAWRTIERAKTFVGVTSARTATGNKSPFAWSLSSSDNDSDGMDDLL